MVISPKPKDVKGLYIDNTEEEAQLYFNEKILPILAKAYVHGARLPNEAPSGLKYAGYILPALKKAGWNYKWFNGQDGGAYVITRRNFRVRFKGLEFGDHILPRIFALSLQGGILASTLYAHCWFLAGSALLSMFLLLINIGWGD